MSISFHNKPQQFIFNTDEEDRHQNKKVWIMLAFIRQYQSSFFG
jgi:hypothetical protein